MSIFSPFSEGNGKIPHKSPIPSKRTQLFLHVLSEKWTSIIGLSLAYSLVLSPEILWMFVHLLFLERQASSATLFSAGQLLLFASVLVILSIISGPGLAVLARWSRDLARFRPLSPRHFVCQALKTCWKEGLILSFFRHCSLFWQFLLGFIWELFKLACCERYWVQGYACFSFFYSCSVHLSGPWPSHISFHFRPCWLMPTI